MVLPAKLYGSSADVLLCGILSAERQELESLSGVREDAATTFVGSPASELLLRRRAAFKASWIECRRLRRRWPRNH